MKSVYKMFIVFLMALGQVAAAEVREAKSLRDEGATLHPGHSVELPEKPDGQRRERHVKRFSLAAASLDTALPVLRRDVPDGGVAVEADLVAHCGAARVALSYTHHSAGRCGT